MKSLILVLFLGVTVALAEIHVENDTNHEHHHGPMLVSLNSLLSFCVVANLVAISLRKILL